MKIVKPIIFRNFDSTRASEATYYDQDGFLSIAPADTLRLGYNPTTLDFIGPIYEEAGVNYGTSSTLDWDANGQEDLGTSGPAIGVDGVTLEFKYGFRDDGSGASATYDVPAGAYVFSIYAKQYPTYTNSLLYMGIGGFNYGRFNVQTGAILSNLNGSARAQALPNGWFRFSVADYTASTNKVRLAVSGPSIGQIGGVIFDGHQVELTTSDLLPSSYMVDMDSPPGGAFSYRAADIAIEEPPRVVTSNVDENDAPLWDEDDAYTAGNQVVVLGQVHKLFESIGANTNKYPPDHPEEWIDQGATNRWRMFDMNVGPDKQTVSTDSSNTVQVLLELDQIVTSVTLLNIDANNVRIIMRDAFGAVVYDHYEDLLQSTPSSDWWSFFFATRSNIKTLVLTDLPSVQPSTIEMVLDGDAFPAKIGKMIVGEAVEIGCARYGTSVGIVDFSRKERDPFGNNFILERRYIDRADFDVQIPTSTIDNVKAILTAARATPTLYIGDEQFASTVIYGFYRDFSIIISGPKRSDLTIQVESI